MPGFSSWGEFVCIDANFGKKYFCSFSFAPNQGKSNLGRQPGVEIRISFLQILQIKSKPLLLSYILFFVYIFWTNLIKYYFSNSLKWIMVFSSHQICNVLQIVPWFPRATFAWVLVLNGGSKVAALVIKAVKLVKLTFYFLNNLNDILAECPAMYVAWQVIIQRKARKFGFVWT